VPLIIYPLPMLTMRQAISAAAAAATMAVCACGRDQSQENEAANTANAGEQQVVPQLAIPAPQPPLGREQLLVAAMRAASDFATGVDDRSKQDELANRKFEFRMRFGCGGPEPAKSEEPFGWSLDKTSGALKVRATPTLSTKNAPVKAIAGEAFEAVEGVWVQRPWLLEATCPRVDTPDKGPAAADMTPKEAPATPEKPEARSPNVGIAQFFTAAGPRTMRRSGRAYEATKRLEAGQDPKDGFDLVLSGRLAPLPDGRVIACTRSPAGERPVCIVSVEFGKVWIERADTHEQIAQWGAG